MAGAGVLLRTFWNLLRVNPGFNSQHLVAGSVSLPVPNDPKADIYAKIETRTALVRESVRRLRAMPGVENAALSSVVPLQGVLRQNGYRVEGAPESGDAPTAVPVSVTDVILNLGRIAIGRSDQLPTEYRLIVFDLRLPRILLGVLVGTALSVSGASFQAMLRNPLADPFILGVSSGAAVGSVLATLIAPRFALITPLGAFLGALATIAAVYFLGRREGQLDSTTLLLGGVISASFLSAIVMFLTTTLAGRDLRGIVFWLMGDLSTPVQPGLEWIFAVGLLAGIGAIYTTAPDLNLLLTGEREAIHLGVDVTRVKLVVYVSASLLTALAVSASVRGVCDINAPCGAART